MALLYSGTFVLLLFYLTYSHGFDVYWNIPTFICEKNENVKFDLTRYNIKHNVGNEWRGNVMNILYHPGEFPYITRKGEWKYGGLPQKGNLTSHLEALARDVKKLIPVNCTGLAVLDQERWRPLYYQNWLGLDVYRKESRNLVEKEHPTWKPNEIKAEAEMQFENAARKYMEESLKLCKRLRPNAKWGYYHFPYCFNKNPPSTICGERTLKANDKIDWMFKLSDALYPSIYLNYDMTEKERRTHAEGRVAEAQRMAKRSGHFPPVYPYVRIRFHATQGYVSKRDLKNTIGLSKQMGVAGVVLWGSSDNTKSLEKCEELKSYLKKDLGPLIVTLTKS